MFTLQGFYVADTQIILSPMASLVPSIFIGLRGSVTINIEFFTEIGPRPGAFAPGNIFCGMFAFARLKYA
jgi:hypothetical protein